MRKVFVSALCMAALAACNIQPARNSGAGGGVEPNTDQTLPASPAVSPPPDGSAEVPFGGKPTGPGGPNVVAAGLVSGPVGQLLDATDRMAINRTTQTVLESGPTNQPMQWSNPTSGHYGTVKPVRTFQPHPSKICRQFQQTAMVTGKTQQAYATACREPDGTWKLQG
jgi:surface antigen